ncbi:leucine-rich repeat-containing protein kinase family protein [Massilia sp. PWRC2]|uniref:leucine-rich repeat-containing protein kinase family protein n=1 Tax=Massilia sp. PWRC2 TaxID=2804626 RepID=UPI003CEF00DA
MHTLEQLHNGSLAGATRLQLSCGLTEFPREIFELADTLEILDLSGNALTCLPDDLPRLRRLRILFCSNNRFSVLPAMLGACAQLTMIGFKSNRISEVPATAFPAALRWLILTDNRIGTLPATIGACAQLQKLMLAGNELTELPPQLAACTALELLRIAANRLSALPPWLLTMPRLAWLAYAGNPVSAVEEAAAGPAAGAIGWHQLTLAHILGAGASGVIHQAQWRQAGQARAVAVKLFKGAITSDGLPACELRACISAGAHPNLIAVLGELRDHPHGVQGCVMALIDPAFASLAGPPSLESCTRDVYASSQRFALAALLGIAAGIAAAAQHLHRRAIMHGDLYAHNIRHSDQGQALLGDFGAASLLAPGPQATALQRLEVRAFGVLLGELLARCDGGDGGTAAVLNSLAQLQHDCVQANVAARPLFADIARRITACHVPQ